MCDLLIQTAFERPDESLASCIGEGYVTRGADEVRRPDLSIVDCLDDGGISNERPERLHHVERKRGPSVPGLMEEAPVTVKSDGGQSDIPGAHEEGIRIGEK